MFCFYSIHVNQGPSQGPCYLAESITLLTITRVQGPHLGILLQSNCILFKGPFSGSCYLVFVASESAFVLGPCLGILLFFCIQKNYYVMRRALYYKLVPIH